LTPGSPLGLRHLIYPVPDQAGLGIHATLDLAGAVRFGPDTEYVATPDLGVDPEKSAPFARAISRYLPGIEPSWLRPDYAGIRPKLAGPGESFRDFVVAEESAAGAPGLIDCIGIESPGLTAAGAIAERVADLI
jgi:L-2-hydroxyglutarate oxidase LhgO